MELPDQPHTLQIWLLLYKTKELGQMIPNIFFSCENSMKQQMMRKEKGKIENYIVLCSAKHNTKKEKEGKKT